MATACQKPHQYSEAKKCKSSIVDSSYPLNYQSFDASKEFDLLVKLLGSNYLICACSRQPFTAETDTTHRLDRLRRAFYDED